MRFNFFRLPSLYIFLVTIIIGGTFLIIQPIVYTNDSGGYLEAARFFHGVSDTKYQYWRTPLFPLLMLITGVADEISLHGLVAFYFLLALSIPLLIYFGIRWINAGVAFVAALLVVASLLPFIDVTFIMPSQLFGFMLILSAFFTWRYINKTQISDIYAIALSSLIVVMVRPQGSYLFVLLLGIAILAAPQKWRHCVSALLLVIAIQFGYMAARPYFAGPIGPIGTDVVLLPAYQSGNKFDDQTLYQRAMLLIRQNAVSEGQFVAGLIKDFSLARQVRLAAHLQPLLNKNLDLAKKSALAELDKEVRDNALFYIAWTQMATGDLTESIALRDQIGSKNLRKKLIKLKGSVPEIPILTAAGLSDENINSSHYITGLDLTNTGGKMLLFMAIKARTIDPNALIAPKNGPATTELYRMLGNYMNNKDIFINDYPNLASINPDPQKATDILFTKIEPYEAHWTLWGTMDRLYGPARADLFLKSVYFEFAKSHTHALMLLYSKILLQALTGHDMKLELMGYGRNQYFPIHPNLVPIPQFKREVTNSQILQNQYMELGQHYSNIFVILVGPIFFIALLGIFLIRERRLFLTWLTCWVIALHQIIICTITCGAVFGYILFDYIFLIIAAVLTGYAAFKLYREHVCRSSYIDSSRL